MDIRTEIDYIGNYAEKHKDKNKTLTACILEMKHFITFYIKYTLKITQ